MRIKVLLAKQAENLKQIKAIQAAAGEKVLTDEQRQQIKDLQAANSQLAEDIVIARETEAAELAMTAAAPVSVDTRAAEATAAAAGVEPAKAPKVEVLQDRAVQAPGYFGRQLQAVRRFAASGGQIDAEDRKLIAPMMAAPTGLNTDVPSEGGFLVSQTRSSTILTRAYTTGAVLSRVARMPIGPGSNGMKLPAIDETSRADNSRFGGIVSGWLGQGNTLTAGKPKFREMDLRLRKVGAFVYATDELLEDAIALEAWIDRYLPLELGFRTEDAIVNGTGSNQPLGLLNSGAVITVTRNTANRVLYDDVKAMWARLWAGARGAAGDLSKTCWLVDQSVEQELEQISIAIGTAGVLAPVYKPAGSTPGQVFATLYGRPIVPVEYGAALGTSGDIILAALDEYTVIDKGEVESAVSLHVAFLTDESVFRFIYRVDGQPNWNAALTPKSGGDTLSSILVLS